jgi:epoxide hydrolase-like predicted phosphatase
VTHEGYDREMQPLREEFHVFVESCKVKLRKPDPRIYGLVCERLDVTPGAAVFLDDIGGNLKAARALGMTTIKVEEPVAAIAELERVVGLELH